jgi:hydroxymethylpyrimidine/phosphomethylpyrimidine kinase
MKDPARVLVVAASDSSGGAGIARDIETVAGFGLQSALALTAVTVQTHDAVLHVAPVEPSIVADQMRTAFSANRIGAVKIGLLPTPSAVAAVAAVLRRYPEVQVVLAPVLKASSGGSLGAADTARAMVAELCPLLSLVTPNHGELAALTGQPVAADEAAVVARGQMLVDAGAAAVLAKGGHGTGASSIDLLLRPAAAPVPFHAPRLDAEMRGTGCMLASAVAAGLARGETLDDSVSGAKQHVLDQLLRIA